MGIQIPLNPVADWDIDYHGCTVGRNVGGEKEKQLQVKRPTGVSAHMQVRAMHTVKVLSLFFLPHFYWILCTIFVPESSTIILFREPQFASK